MAASTIITLCKPGTCAPLSALRCGAFLFYVWSIRLNRPGIMRINEDSMRRLDSPSRNTDVLSKGRWRLK